MKIKTFIADAFTDKLFKGNPAAVCILKEAIPEENMIQIAKEFGFSESAFVIQKGPADFSIRYFSPVTEIPLCGHATMASAKVLFSEYPGLDTLTFKTQFGHILELRSYNNQIEMVFPVHETEKSPFPDDIKNAIGIQNIINCEYNKDHNILMVEIESSKQLEELSPDFATLKQIKTTISGVLVTAPSARTGYDFEYRYFWPWSGSNEDPVTGGVQSFLCKYWSVKLDKKILNAFQCSERTGSMQVELKGDQTIIRSNAVIFLAGEMNQPAD
ncbi:putative isomerase YddE [Chryseobacterium oranimense G311]|uniref:PhzF family phenazine biosynthesis protein n=1 Tax=Chryseobacterium oranimense TaxID=421058 RepID=UPI00053377FC|nr:PhzF family phenazine biosynthesis isomerase [Chryseobacterium oranimense]CEJ69850.1 putative isomerase YddE [Chryseobacterium oranimense G311]